MRKITYETHWAGDVQWIEHFGDDAFEVLCNNATLGIWYKVKDLARCLIPQFTSSERQATRIAYCVLRIVELEYAEDEESCPIMLKGQRVKFRP